ncbi:MAG TPA: phospho-N-acetylmuramoyl-pentapeptide-transferase [Saprospiraceae bacterium]|nr:phospho-N-acetylmuramoyl-pentapeptide-transferase [Saprospiraceae bacterium]
MFKFLKENYDLPGAGLFQYISFRSGASIILSLIISMVFGGRIIRSLKKLQVGETIRDLGLTGQMQKAGTPTMGGFIIILSTVIPCLLFAKLDNIYIIVMLITTVWMTAIGFADDYIKVFKKDKQGLKGVFKVVGQIGLGLFIALVMLLHEDVVVRVPLEVATAKGYEIIERFQTTLPGVNVEPTVTHLAYVKTTLTNLPFIKGNLLEYDILLSLFTENPGKWAWLVFVPICIIVVTAVSNAANLTDGIDGLAAGVSAIVGATLGVLAYVSSNTIIASYLNILFIPHSEELVIYAACFLGGCIGFLWYNCYPARVFMGDTGSLTIGGVIACLALLLRKEWLIPILCGIFLVENLSVMLQVGYFKYTRRKFGEGRRIFKMSPLHHHYQKLGMHESTIATRFWIVGIILAVITIITLKVR